MGEGIPSFSSVSSNVWMRGPLGGSDMDGEIREYRASWCSTFGVLKFTIYLDKKKVLTFQMMLSALHKNEQQARDLVVSLPVSVCLRPTRYITLT